MAVHDNVTPIRGRACPICGDRTSMEHRPFCSVRCKDIDLSRWLGGHYRIATSETAPERPADHGDDSEY
ncbi:MAG: DNA gyrase inhibitor YacG [Alphaproteobacteria bacterium]|jgi:hypothetical protein